jgi:hypothetical protein
MTNNKNNSTTEISTRTYVLSLRLLDLALLFRRQRPIGTHQLRGATQGQLQNVRTCFICIRSRLTGFNINFQKNLKSAKTHHFQLATIRLHETADVLQYLTTVRAELHASRALVRLVRV